MRTLFLGGLLACLLIATAAQADLTPCKERSAKSASHVLSRVGDDREGGDTIATALPITLLPFTDTGATCDDTDDYDEQCPFDGSVAPDVVYSFTPATDTLVRIDLGGSAYDTKVYVYDERLELVACNDDGYPDYTSLIDYLKLQGGATYFIVVDGYGTECGAYALSVTVREPCTVICPAGAMLEGEPPLVDDYVDELNGGCCGSEFGHPFQELPGRSNETLVFCGGSGWYTVSGGLQTRDTDWFTLTMGSTGILEIRGDASLPLYLFHLGPNDCNSVGVLQNVILGRCEEGAMTIEAEPGSEVWIWTGPTTFEPPGGVGDNEFGYVLWLEGVAPATLTGVPVEPLIAPRSLSTIKGLFD